MTSSSFYNAVLIGWLVLAALTVPYLLFVAAPYGRHMREGWGPKIENRLGWILMELPSPLAMVLFFILGTHSQGIAPAVFLGMWLLHYINRSIIYPLRIRGKKKYMPVVIMGSAIFFNVTNGFLQGRYVFDLSGGYSAQWLHDPCFLVGAALFLAGFAANYHSDSILRNLRKPGETGYKIPKGGLFRFVTSPNYFAEIIEWTGWAVATWSLPGLAFVLWTAANLVPRALKHHKWCQEKFSDYPVERKAIIPFVL